MINAALIKFSFTSYASKAWKGHQADTKHLFYLQEDLPSFCKRHRGDATRIVILPVIIIINDDTAFIEEELTR